MWALDRRILSALVIITVITVAPSARGDLYGFVNITGNNPVDAMIGESQLFMDVGDSGSGQVLFTFLNEGPLPSSITDVYFDDGDLSVLSAIAFIDNSDPGVLFSEGASPSDLPGGETLANPFSADFSADADPPPSHNGVGPLESVGFVFDLTGGVSFGDVLGELASGDLRVGIHVQGFEGGGSESFINPPVPVPVPGAVLLGVLGLTSAGWFRRRFA